MGLRGVDVLMVGKEKFLCVICSALLGVEKGMGAEAGLLGKVPTQVRISLPTMVTQTLGSSSPTDI